MTEAKHVEKQRRSRPLAAALALALLAAAGLAGWQLYARQSQIGRLEEELLLARQSLEQAESELEDLQARLDRVQETSLELEAQLTDARTALEEATLAAQEARAALAEKLAEEAAEEGRNDGSPYAGLYPELYAAPAERESAAPANTVYLTFDDGPSARTAEVLDILKENGVKATFFVTGQTGAEAEALMRRIVEEGHTIGVHTYTHQYWSIYASVPAYLEDFNRIYTLVHEVTGVYPQVFRFPGGTVNSYNKEIYREIVSEMDRRGFVHYDWNALNGDAEGKDYTVAQMTEKALARVGTSHVIVLMHDSKSKTKTVECLPQVIAGYREAGYAFAPLTPEIKAITFD